MMYSSFRKVTAVFVVISSIFASLLLGRGEFAYPAAADGILLNSVTCESPVYAGLPFRTDVTLTEAPTIDGTWVRITPSNPDLVPWGDDNEGTLSLSFEPGWITQSGSVFTNPIEEEAVLTLTFDLLNWPSETILDTRTCDVQITRTLVPSPTPEPGLSSVSCTSPVYAGSQVNYRVELAAPNLNRSPRVQITPSMPGGGGVEAFWFESGATVYDGTFATPLINDDAVFTLTFNLFGGGWTEDVIVDSKQCQVDIIGLHNPTPTITPTSGPPTPSPTATPVPEPSIRTIYMQTGSRAGGFSKVTVCLDRAAPVGGWNIGMTSDEPALFPVPATVQMPAGRACLSLVIPVADSNRMVLVTVTASFGGVTVSGSTLVRPTKPVVYTQTVSRALGLSKVTVCRIGPGTSGGTVVPLTNDRPDLFPVPATVTIPSGRACLSLAVPVGYVESDTAVTITATFDTGPKSGTTVVRNMGTQPLSAPARGIPGPPLTVTSEPPLTNIRGLLLPLGVPVSRVGGDRNDSNLAALAFPCRTAL